MKKGLFISFEGPDGSGKSTQIKLLAKFLSERGIDFILTREPGGTSIGEKIRSIILDPAGTEMSGRAEMLLYAAARAQIVDEVIRPNIEAGKIVLCDRFVDSSYAYQGCGRGLGDAVIHVNQIAVGEFMPDLTILLDIDPVKCFGRKRKSASDRIEAETIAWHTEVYKAYLELAAKYPDRIIRINADRPVSEIQNDIRKAVTDLIGHGKQDGPE